MADSRKNYIDALSKLGKVLKNLSLKLKKSDEPAPVSFYK